ncbi:MAG: glutamate--tRNA ligase [Bacillota bacterium]
MEEIRVRFAPSPTGPLHIGGARSALFNYLVARKYGGKLIVRIEDTDLERSSKESEQDILEALRWLGIDWNEGAETGGPHGPYRQTERLPLYNSFVEKLFESGHAYLCFCTEEELATQREELLAREELPRYLGNCRKLTREEQEKCRRQGRSEVVRFRVPDDETIVVKDLVRGEVTFESNGIGDFIIVKSDGIPTYNFAVVVDDAEMRISHVIRAEEHLSNTPRQILLFRALGIEPPLFAHISLILGKDKSKMSKRHGATSVVQYRQDGYLPEALVNFLALLGWSPEGEQEIFTREELIKEFSLERVAKSPAVFDLDKLNWINGCYIRQSCLEKITDLAIPYLREAGLLTGEIDCSRYEWLTRMVAAVRNYLSNMSEITGFAQVFFGDQVTLADAAAREILREEQVPAVIELFKKKIMDRGELSQEEARAILKETGKELKLGGKKVFLPLRVALTGQQHGPELHDLLPLLGVDRIIKRLDGSMTQV